MEKKNYDEYNARGSSSMAGTWFRALQPFQNVKSDWDASASVSLTISDFKNENDVIFFVVFCATSVAYTTKMTA